MRTITKEIYTFDDLSEEAKETAIQGYRENAFEYDWWDAVFDDFERIANILGITFDTHSVPLYGGGTRQEPDIWFTGFWSQGDGASFAGYYEYKPGALKEIKQYAPLDTELHEIAVAMQEIQRKNFYQFQCHVAQSGRYSHEYTMTVDSIDRIDEKAWTDDAEDDILECFRDLARWLYAQLEKEYEYLQADEQIIESIRANEYEFTEDGEVY